MESSLARGLKGWEVIVKSFLRALMATATAVVAVLAAAGAAAATPPQTVVVPYQTTDTYAAGSLCAFPVRIVISEEDRQTTFFGQDGVRVVEHVSGGSVSTNLATGVQVHGTCAFTGRDVVYGFGEWTGRQATLFGTDGGVIEMRAGRQMLDNGVFSQVGHWDTPSLSAFCAALSG